ncbi:MAG: hypothetical protein IGS39_02785 [Calothrix sp. C42_A2020_038]|nr:hypothetical protein [Calothrix sp. C42_A2020_038]
MMSIIKRMPWVSLSLALLTYCCLGWVVSKSSVSPSTWLAIVAIVVLMIGALLTPWLWFNRYSNSLLQSSTRNFCVSILAAFSLFLMITWFRLFLDILLIVSATILVRIDLQTLGFRSLDIFGVLCFTAMSGLAMGIVVSQFI